MMTANEKRTQQKIQQQKREILGPKKAALFEGKKRSRLNSRVLSIIISLYIKK